jgi:hypothetical protein
MVGRLPVAILCYVSQLDVVVQEHPAHDQI